MVAAKRAAEAKRSTDSRRLDTKPGWSAKLEDRLLRDGVEIFDPENNAVLYAPPDDTMEIEGGRIVECLSRERKKVIADVVRRLDAHDDLLAALESLVADADSDHWTEEESGHRIVTVDSVERARSAIKKARGS